MAEMLTDSKVKWDLADIILILSLTFGLTFIVFLGLEWLIETFLQFDYLRLIKPLLLNLIQALLLAGLTLFLAVVKYGVTLQEFGLKNKNFRVSLKYGFLGGVIICLMIITINNFFYGLVSNLFGIEVPAQQVIYNLLNSQTLLFFLLQSSIIIIIAPVTEEIFFRGFVYPYCKSKMGKTRGLILNGALFGLAHFSLWVFLPTFLGGVILAWLYEKTNSLYSSIIAHSVWNLLVVIVIYIVWYLDVI
ncbi:CPBP family intramembrane metalloprotease [Natroniella sulfidigena]|uniref:CPBP family intramembrane glutamic endopeptidase n=1 Tax=Natroniella sulfidigena TaxID=723921 RepID=UPI00200A258A|nr:type II CAAX endopeptidase family protein [Natroniella sulfidigena]MCK8817993.1 CPBP family intramembrane metalloprotease [Natroniella sulfidigena]